VGSGQADEAGSKDGAVSVVRCGMLFEDWGRVQEKWMQK